MYIEVRNAVKQFLCKNPAGGDEKFVTVLGDVSLSIERGEFVCLLGPSGCGKTTLVNAMAGFEKLTSGSVVIDGETVTRPSPRYVTIFQNYGLLPWRSVRKNVELGLESSGLTPEERDVTAERYLKLVNLSAFAEQHPCRLSGGQQQRVAIARALAVNPEILFMDEPFGALDAITRYKLQNDLREIVRRECKTVVFVTHDIDEAVFLADHIVVMEPNPGRIRKILPVKLSHPRVRNESGFVELRKEIFREFFHVSDRSIEYFI
ncbi:MAG: Bicarbonate transport ATP-binding protein CmpD [Lentisphaerae bacterium ADurb.Bin242]|nr:MAG: Bicarbonate transport ATP-binding protein CmpD [Lentisphaerae bacterium ADurb.Bin242]